MSAVRSSLALLSPEMRAQAEVKLAALPRRTHRHEGAARQPKPKITRKVGLLARISEPAERLAFHMKAEGIAFVREYEFWPERKFRADFAIPASMLLFEVDGGIWTGGRHLRPEGYERDQIKRNEAVILGWRLFNFTPSMISSGYAINMIKRALRIKTT